MCFRIAALVSLTSKVVGAPFLDFPKFSWLSKVASSSCSIAFFTDSYIMPFHKCGPMMVRWCDGYVSESWSKQSVLARRFALFSSEDQFCFEEQPFFGSLLLTVMWCIMLKTFTRSWLHMADLPLNFAVRNVRVTHRSSNITYDHRVILVLFETRVYRYCKHAMRILGFVCSQSSEG